jgi:hypothetical protein
VWLRKSHVGIPTTPKLTARKEYAIVRDTSLPRPFLLTAVFVTVLYSLRRTGYDSQFSQKADFLQEELQAFFRVLRLGNDVEAIRSAAERLRKTIDEIEPLATDPGDAWKDLASDQRWAYLRMLSHLGTAGHEIKAATQQIQQRTAVNS